MRSAVRGGVRLLLKLAYRIRVNGRQRFPHRRPLIVVGYHVAPMESALVTVLTPWQLEVPGAADMPHERVNQFMLKLYGAIPVHRGSVDRPAMRQAVEALAQGGVLGALPEGGIPEAGEGHSLIVIPVRRHRITETGDEITETDQGAFRGWR